jgi:hypothetical protein
MKAVPYAGMPVVMKPAVCRACRPLVDPADPSAAQPRSIVPPQWAKSTTTMTPVVVEQSPIDWAPTGPAVTIREAAVPAVTVPAAASTSAPPANHRWTRRPRLFRADRRRWAIRARFPGDGPGALRRAARASEPRPCVSTAGSSLTIQVSRLTAASSARRRRLRTSAGIRPASPERWRHVFVTALVTVPRRLGARVEIPTSRRLAFRP